MTRALWFLLLSSLKNRIRLRFERLRQPKYLISALAGLTYLYIAFIHNFIFKTNFRQTFILTKEGIAAIEIDFGFMLLLAVAFQCIFVKPQARLLSEAEVQFLFPSPLPPASVIHYRIAKSQIGILAGTLLSVLVLQRNAVASHTAFLLITLWLIFSFLFLLRMAVMVAAEKQKLRSWALGFCLLALAVVIVWAKWLRPSSPMPSDLLARIHNLCEAGPGFYLVYPFRLMVRPVFASSWAQFTRMSLPILAMMALVYAKIRRSRSLYEISVLGQTEKAELAGANTSPTNRHGRLLPFYLAPNGFAPLALYWKNLVQASAVGLRWLLPALAVLAVLVIGITKAWGEEASMAVGTIAAVFAAFMTFLGPIMLRDDLRTDLIHIELLKTYPLSGAAILFGEILGPVTILVVSEWLLIAIGAAVLPGSEGVRWQTHDRIAYGFTAALLLPCLSILGILIQNATVLLLPGWVQLGKEHAQGVEAMGQRLISAIATGLFLLITALPAAVLFVVVFAMGYKSFGTGVVPFAALSAALVLLAEAGIGVLLLGRLFEKFDPTS